MERPAAIRQGDEGYFLANQGGIHERHRAVPELWLPMQAPFAGGGEASEVPTLRDGVSHRGAAKSGEPAADAAGPPKLKRRSGVPFLLIGVGAVLALVLAAAGGGLLVWLLAPRSAPPPAAAPVAVNGQASRQLTLLGERTPPAEAPKKEEAPRKREPPLFRGKTADDWLKQIAISNTAVRREAIKGLAEVIAEAQQGRGVPAQAPAALQALCGVVFQDPKLEKEVLESLGLTGPRAKEAALVLLRPFPGQGGSAVFLGVLVEAILRVGPEVIPELLEALHDDDYEVRARAYYVLSYAAVKQHIEGRKNDAIRQALETRKRRLWQWRANDLEVTEQVLRLLEGLHEKGEHFRISARNDAAQLLKQVGPLGRVAIPELFRAHSLPAARIDTADKGILANPIAAGQERDRLPPELEKYAELLDALAKTNDAHLRLGPKAIPELLALLRLPPGHRIPHAEIVRTLGQYGSAAKDAIPALRGILKQREFGICTQVLWQLRPLSPVCLIVGQAGTSPLAVVADMHWMVEEHTARARNIIEEHNRRMCNPNPLAWAYDESAYFEIVCALFRIDPGGRAMLLPLLKSWQRSSERWIAISAALLLAAENVVDRDTFEALLRTYDVERFWQPRPYELEIRAKELSQLRPQTQKTLLELGRPALKSTDVKRRLRAAWMLAPLDPDACLPVLVEALKTENPVDLILTEHTLARLGPKAKTAFAILRARLEQARKTNFLHYDTVSEAHSLPAALGQVDPDAAIPLLLELWRAKSDKPLEWWQSPSAGAFDELLQLAPRLQTAIPAVMDELKSPDGYSKEAEQLLVRIGPPALTPLREATQGADLTCRARAVHALGQMGDNAKPALPALLKLLADKDANVRREAVRALGQIDPRTDKAIAALGPMRKDTDGGVRHEVIRVLGKSGPSAAPLLAKVLADADGGARLAAVAALGRLGAAGVPSLRSSLQHKDVQVRRLAVLTLGHLGPDTPGTVPALIEATRDRDRLTRRLAVSLLDRPGQETAQVLPVLVKALSDEDAEVRWTAAFVLEELSAKDAETVSALAQALTDQDRDVRRRALFALGAIGPEAKSAISAIKKMLIEGEDLHAEAASVLVRISTDPVALFAEILPSTRDRGRDVAATILVQLGPRSVPVLVRWTAAENELELRHCAIRCLGQINGQAQTVVPTPVALLQDKNLRIRLDAIFALESLGPQAKDAIAPLRKIAENTLDLARDEAARALQRIEPNPRLHPYLPQ
jgi:HEAT repeat protein